MSWNNSSERQRFKKAQRRQEKKYRELGMTEEQIKAMYEFDLKQFQSDRSFYSHTVSLERDWNDFQEDNSYDSSDVRVTAIDSFEGHSRLWWIEELENPSLSEKMKQLSEADIKLLTLYVFEELNQAELAVVFGIAQQSISKRIKKIEKFLSNRV